jgi:hypothetical protein
MRKQSNKRIDHISFDDNKSIRSKKRIDKEIS